MSTRTGVRLLLTLLFIAPAAIRAQDGGERAAVRAAVLDYVEGVYNAEPGRIKRSVHPELSKLGYYRRSEEEPYRPAPMTFDQLVEVARTWNDEGRDMSTAPKEIHLFDVLDQTASVKLVAAWGIDYMHLAKVHGTWKIVKVLWQSHPPNTTPAGHH